MRLRSLQPYLLIGLLMVSACNPRGTPLQNIENAPLNARSGVTLEQISDTIIRAGVPRGWQMYQKEPGHIVATVTPRSHSATVDIKFNTKTLSIVYVESVNLNYDGVNIHKNYTRWTRKLRDDIQRKVLNLQPSNI